MAEWTRLGTLGRGALGPLGRAILVRALSLGTGLVLGNVAAAPAQQLELRGYYLHVALAADSGPFNASGITDVQRARFTLHPATGPLALEVAYEHILVYTTAAGSAGSLGGLGQARSRTDWLPLQGTLRRSQHLEWRHRADRFSLRYATSRFEVTDGRQPVSWATTLFLTPADPFAPLDPSEPFREYGTGVDALRARSPVPLPSWTLWSGQRTRR